MTRILITGDIHVDGAKIGKDNPATELDYRIEDVLIALNYIIEVANTEDVDIFVLNGDLFKGRTSTHQIETIIAEMIQQKLNPKIQKWFNLGNHDYTPKQLALGVYTYSIFERLQLPNARFNLDISHISLDDVDVVLYPYYDLKRTTNFETNEELISWISSTVDGFKLNKKRKIFIGHGTPAGTIFHEDYAFDLDAISEPVLPTSMFDKFDYALFSHIHRQHWIGNKIFHIGSPERVDFGEANDDKGFVIYDSKTNQVKWYSTNPRPMVDLKLDFISLTEFDDPNQLILDQLSLIKEPERTMVKVTVECTERVANMIDYPQIKNKLSTFFHHAPLNVKYEKVQQTKDKEVTEQLTIEQALDRVVSLKPEYSDNDKLQILLRAKQVIMRVDNK